jgi:hypothetical protein
MARCCAAALALLALALLATMAAAGRSLRADADFLALNKTLNALKIEIDTATLAPVAGTTSGLKYSATFRPGAYCGSLGLKSASVNGASKPSSVVNGTTYEVYEVTAAINSFSFECVLPVTLVADVVGTRQGTIRVLSTQAMKSNITLGAQALSTSFASATPQLAREAPLSCADQFKLSVTFSSQGLGSWLFVNVDNLVAGELNGNSKASTVKVLQDQLCSMTGNLTSSVVNLVRSNPVSELIANLSTALNAGAGPGSNSAELTGVEQVPAAAVSAEKALAAKLPGSVDLVDLRSNSLVRMLLDGGLGGLGGGNGAAPAPVTGDELFAKLAGLLGIPVAAGQNPLLLVLDSFLGTTLASSGGRVAELDLLAIAGAKFPGLLALLSLNVSLPDMGSLNGTVSSLTLTTTPPPASAPSTRVDLVSGQSLVLPTLALGGVSITAGLSVSVAIKTTALFNLTVAYAAKEDFRLTLSLQELLAKAAVLLPIDQNAILRLELGPALRALSDCLTSTFAAAPGLSAALLRTGDIALAASLIDDGLLSLLGDLLNNFITPIYGKLLGGVAGPTLRKYLVDAVGGLVKLGSCPRVERNATTLRPVNLTSSELFAMVKGLLPVDVGSLLAGLLGGSGHNGTLELLAQPVPLLDLALPGQGSPRLQGSIGSVLVGNALPPDVRRAVLLDVSSTSRYFPRGLNNELEAFSAARPLQLNVSAQLNSVLPSGSGSGSAATAAPSVARNQIRAGISIANVSLAAELFAAYSLFDIESVQVQDVLHFNLDCFAAKLERGGGLKRVALALGGVAFSFSCTACDNPFFATLFERLSRPASVATIVGWFNKELVPYATSAVTGPFEEDRWAATVADASRRCAGLQAPTSNGTAAPVATAAPTAESQASAQKRGSTYAFLGLFFATVGAAGLLTCGSSFGRRAATDSADAGGPEPLKRGASSFGPAAAAGAADEPGSWTTEDARAAALAQHPLVPRAARLAIPPLLLANLALFVLGHVNVVMSTSAVGNVAGYKVGLDNFGQLSVIKTVGDLWTAKAYVLALLICALSVVWPYVKLALMALGWFLPARRLSFERRGAMLVALDQLGKWSLVELFFVAQALVILQLRFAAPDTELLPAGLYELAIVITANYNLYTFTGALLCSLALSNVMVIYHDRIGHHALEAQRTRAGRAGDDLERVSLRDCVYDAQDASGVAYRVRISALGTLLLLAGLATSLAAFAYAGTRNVIRLEFYGLARSVLQFSGQETVEYVSMFSFICDSFKVSEAGRVLFSVAFLITAAVVPALQLASLAVVPLWRFTLRGALTFFEANMVLCAWSALEVFVLAVGVVTLEMETISKFLVRDVCQGVSPLMGTVLVPLGLVDASDVPFSCLAIQAYVELGAWLFVATLLLANLVHFGVMRMFKAYLDGRAHAHLRPTADAEGQENHAQARLPPAMAVLRALRVIQVVAPGPRTAGSVVATLPL